jgi:hypothetical protein
MKMVKIIGDEATYQEVNSEYVNQFKRNGWAVVVEAPQKFPEIKQEPEIKETILAPEKTETTNPPKHKGGRGNKKI